MKVSVAVAAAAVPTNNSSEDDCAYESVPSIAQAAKQAEINARRAALSAKDYSVEEDTTASNNDNSKGQKSTKRKSTTKEVRAAAVLARQGLVGPSDLTPTITTNNGTSSSTKDGASEKSVSAQGMSMGTPAEGERVTGTAATISRKKSKSNAKVNVNAKPRLPVIGPGKRCKIKRKHVYPLLEVGTEASARIVTKNTARHQDDSGTKRNTTAQSKTMQQS